MDRRIVGNKLLAAGFIFAAGSFVQVARGQSEIVLLVLAAVCIGVGIKNRWRYHHGRRTSDVPQS